MLDKVALCTDCLCATSRKLPCVCMMSQTACCVCDPLQHAAIFVKFVEAHVPLNLGAYIPVKDNVIYEPVPVRTAFAARPLCKATTKTCSRCLHVNCMTSQVQFRQEVTFSWNFRRRCLLLQCTLELTSYTTTSKRRSNLSLIKHVCCTEHVGRMNLCKSGDCPDTSPSV